MNEELIFCPLGGSGEIGMNMNLFAFGKPDNRKWIIVDIGVTFADDSIPGICYGSTFGGVWFRKRV